MTTKRNNPPRDKAKKTPPRSAPSKRGSWPLREAKARLSEVVTLAHNEGPQRVTVHGKKEVVIVAADQFKKLKGELTGRMLVEALANSPLRDVEFDRLSVISPVRDVDL
jgi:prevent-host-death family protein